MSAEGDQARDWAEEVSEMNAPVSSADRRILARLLRELAEIADEHERACEVLARPLDPARVLDTHSGRALWGATLADEARRMLTPRAEDRKPGGSR